MPKTEYEFSGCLPISDERPPHKIGVELLVQNFLFEANRYELIVIQEKQDIDTRLFIVLAGRGN